MGVAGAAWATSVSQLVSFVVLLVLNRRCAAIKVKLSRFTPQLHYFYKIFTGGVPSLCRQGVGSIATVLLNLAAGNYGGASADAAIAAMGVVNRISMFANSALAAVRAARRKSPLTVVEGDGEVGVKGKNFEVLFSYGEAGLSSLKIDGYEWMWRAPRPAFWRAGTDNDRGCGFPQRAAAWMTADIFAQCIGWKLAETSQDRVVMRYTFAVPMVPDVTADVTYTVEAAGTLLVQAEYHGAPNAPELPCFGIKFQTTASVSRTQWVGLSGETYPDRCKGGVFGCWQEIPHVEPALVPQDCGIHMQTRQVMLQRDNAFGRIKQSLTLEAVDKPFAFSALPNTAQEIEAAQHIEELPVTGRTSVTVLGAVRGVGGIDSWGTDVEEPYRISGAQDHSVVFRIVL